MDTSIKAAIKPTNREIRAPYHVRVKTSLPAASVPNQCSFEGGWYWFGKSCLFTSYGANIGPTIAINANKTRKINPSIANLFFTRRRQASLQYDKEGRATASAAASSLSVHVNQSSGTFSGYVACL